VASWDGGGQGACASRLFLGTLDARLIALDAVDGHPCQDFGDNGQIYAEERRPAQGGRHLCHHLRAHRGWEMSSSSARRSRTTNPSMSRWARCAASTSAPARLLWAWDPIPWALGQTPRTGAGNAWSTISADPALGLIYVPTGSAAPDYYGGLRPGDNRDADSVVALDAATGTKRWAFQVVHHNLWDYDVAAQPVLFTWRDNTPAVAVTTKMGQVFVLDRRTGAPLFPVAEVVRTQRPTCPARPPRPTQPISSLPAVGPTTLDYSSNGWQRDAAQRGLLRDPDARPPLRRHVHAAKPRWEA
jgi:quinoprotein glucose dehydrogenase